MSGDAFGNLALWGDNTTWNEDPLPPVGGRLHGEYSYYTTFLHSNSLGSTGVTTMAGTYVNDEIYDPWGQHWRTGNDLWAERWKNIFFFASAQFCDSGHSISSSWRLDCGQIERKGGANARGVTTAYFLGIYPCRLFVPGRVGRGQPSCGPGEYERSSYQGGLSAEWSAFPARLHSAAFCLERLQPGRQILEDQDHVWWWRVRDSGGIQRSVAAYRPN